MNKDKLIREMTERGMSYQDAKEVVDGIIEIIKRAIKEDGEISIAGFGRLYKKYSPPRAFFNAQEKKQEMSQGVWKIRFSPFKGLKDLVN